jgi:hypothetical protein
MQQTQADLRSLFQELTGLDLRRDFGEFSTRLAFQKVMYLLQSSSALSPARKFGFHLYGPYSSEWAKAGFEVRDGKTVEVTVTDALANVRPLLRSRSTDELVALATLHFYHERYGLSKGDAWKRAVSDGKASLLPHFDKTWNELQSHKWLHARD